MSSIARLRMCFYLPYLIVTTPLRAIIAQVFTEPNTQRERRYSLMRIKYNSDFSIGGLDYSSQETGKHATQSRTRPRVREREGQPLCPHRHDVGPATGLLCDLPDVIGPRLKGAAHGR